MKLNLTIILTITLFLTGTSLPSLQENPFGVLTFLTWNHWWNNYMYPSKREIAQAIFLIKRLGVSFIRLDFSWNDLEKEKNNFDFERYDYIVQLCKKNNIKILGILGYTPEWTGKKWNNPPTDITSFKHYIKTVVSRYPYIKHWEFWNEPDSFIYWQPQDEMKTYTHLLQIVYTTIKSINPKIKVLLGGLTEEGFFSFKRILQQGGGNYFDIVNFHFFPDPFSNNSFKRIHYKLNHIRNELKKNELDKKIWITEVGTPGIKDNKNCRWWLGKCPNEEEQAIFLYRVMNYLIKEKNVEKIFWAFFQDTKDHFHNGVDYFGLVHKDFSLKPSFYTYQKLIHSWQ